MKNSFICLIFSFVIIVLISQSCKPKIDRQSEIKSLMNVDRSFSELSSRTGRNNAFLHFIDSGAVMLRDNSRPLVSADSIRNQLQKRSDSGYKLTWEPVFADVSISGDLGYTYGIYDLWLPDEHGKFVSMQRGTYVTIWKKDADGTWKWVLDSGNEGLGEK